MASEVVGLIGVGALIILIIVIELPIGVAMLITGSIGMLVVRGDSAAIALLRMVPADTPSKLMFVAIPLFILMGNLAANAGIAGKAFDVVNLWLGRLKGGLCLASIGACAFFAAVSGSSIATASTIGKIAVPQMMSRGYSPRISAGCVAAAGTLGILIPPSIVIIILAWITEQSVGKLLVAGFIPGILSAAIYMGMILIWALRPGVSLCGPSVPWGERIKGSLELYPFVLLVLVVLGSIYTGICTPNEAAAIGAIATLLLGMVMRWLTPRLIWLSLKESAQTNCSLFIIIIGAAIFAKFLIVTGLPSMVSEMIIEADVNRWVFFALVLLMYTILGMFLDPLSMQLITLPVMFPAAVALGFNPIWFVIIAVKMNEIALITPPLGLNVYTMKAVLPQVKLIDIWIGILPFLAMDFLTIVILSLFPQIVLFLPNTMG